MPLTSIFDIEFSPHKYLVHMDRLRDIAGGLAANPVTMELDICSGCDHKCEWCVDPGGSHTGRLMPIKTVIRLLDEAVDLGIKGIVFKGGGESTLHPEFPRILAETARRGFEIGLVTHGGRLADPEISEALIKHASYVRISVDGPTAESRREIHGVDDFSTLTNGIRLLVACRGKNRHPVIGATYCLDYARRGLIEKCIALGESLNLDYVLVRPPFCEEVGFAAPHTPQEAAELRERMRSAAERYDGDMAVFVGNWTGDRELEYAAGHAVSQRLARRDIGVRRQRFNGIEHSTNRCLACSLTLVVTAELEVYGCCCLRAIPAFCYGVIDYDTESTLAVVLAGETRSSSLAAMQNAECLEYCTHPLSDINSIIEYLAQKHKHHSSFI